MKLESKEFGKYLYLGCGNDRMSKFTHVDLNIAKRLRGFPDIFADITKRIPLPDNHANLIFSRGTMEHLQYAELINCFIENYRVLKKGGVVRMLVPDFDIMIEKYLSKENSKVLSKEQESWNLYDRIPRNGAAETFNYRALYHDHFYLHNIDTLSRALKKCGFVNIRKAKPGDTIVTEVSDILKEAEIGRLKREILIEAQKGDIPSTLKMLNKPLPKNPFLFIFAKFFNIRITSFIKRKAFFPELRWFAEKALIIFFLLKGIFAKKNNL